MKIVEKYSQMSLVAKAALWYTFCNVLQKGILFFTIPVYTRNLTTYEYGQYSVFQSWRDLLIIPVTLNLYCGVYTKAMVDYPNDRDRYTSSMQGLGTIITISYFFIYLSSIDFWNHLVEINFTTGILLFLYYITFPAYSFWTVRQRVEYRYKLMVIVTVILSLFTPIFSIVLLFVTDLHEYAVIWGTLIVQIIFGLFFYFTQFMKGGCFYNRNYWIHALKFNIPLIPHYLSLIVLSQADRIMIKNMCGSEKAGIYSLAYQVSSFMNILISAIHSSLIPWLYEQYSKKKYDRVGKMANELCILIAGMTFFFMLSAPEIIMILGTKEYMEAIWIIPAVVLSVYVVFCYNFFSAVEFYYNATKFIMVASTAGAVMNIVLNWVFIRRAGFIAAGYTTLFCYSLLLVMHYLFMRKLCKRQTEKRKIYDIKFIFLTVLVLLALTFLCLIAYQINVIRYTLILIMVISIVILRDSFMKIINDLVTNQKEIRE